MRKKDGLTLIELLLVISIIITLASIAIAKYNKPKARAVQKEALSNIKLIASAERIYRMEMGDYYACSCSSSATCSNNATGCNSILRLMLNTQNWAYGVTTAGSLGNLTANISASAQGGGCTYTLVSGDFDSKNYSTSSGCI
jgi:type II secretory pathway pseudopilin PulG